MRCILASDNHSPTLESPLLLLFHGQASTWTELLQTGRMAVSNDRLQ